MNSPFVYFTEKKSHDQVLVNVHSISLILHNADHSGPFTRICFPGNDNDYVDVIENMHDVNLKVSKVYTER